MNSQVARYPDRNRGKCGGVERRIDWKFHTQYGSEVPMVVVFMVSLIKLAKFKKFKLEIKNSTQTEILPFFLAELDELNPS